MRLIHYLLFIILCCSCSSTRYYTSVVDSKDPYVNKDNKGFFVVEGDSVSLRYSFSGENAPIKIRISNKMNRPVFVDWQNSLLMVNNSNFQVAYADYIDQNQSVIPILPKSEREQTVIESCNFNFANLATTTYKKGEYVVDKTKKIKELDFSERNTPYLLKSNLCLYVGTMGKELILFENQFYISSVKAVSKSALTNVDQCGDVAFTKIEKVRGSNNDKPNTTEQILEVIWDILRNAFNLSSGE